MILLSRLGVMVCGLFLLAGCAAGPGIDQDKVSSMNRNMAQAYYVNASGVTVENRYNPLADAKDISSTLPTALDKAVRQYAENRFRPGGEQGVFHFVIEDASVFQDEVPPTVRIGQVFGIGNQDRYTAIIKVNLYRDGPSGVGPLGYEMRIERTLTMPADVSLDERDTRLSAFVTDLLNDLDQSATDKIGNVLKLSAPQPTDLAPSPGPYPPVPVEESPIP